MAQLGLFGDPPAPPQAGARAGAADRPRRAAPQPTVAGGAPEPTEPAATSPGPPEDAATPVEAAAIPLGPPLPPLRPRTVDVEAGPFSTETLGKELNQPQLEAVVAPGVPMLVVAGAGSGKTRVITYRIARLVAAGGDPKRILSVTFTNKAAGEMRERVSHLLWERLGVSAGGLWLGTFHALSARLLRIWGAHIGLKKDFVVYDDDDQKRLLARVLIDLAVPERLFPVRQVLSAIDRAKNQGLRAGDFQGHDYFDDVVGKAYTLYEQRLRAANATDFGGLLIDALRLCEEDTPAREEIRARFDHVLVDEFQDTNAVQYRLVRLLSNATNSITVVGDEDQSIYRWRGADIRNILDFERDHPGARVVKLEQNYRSTGHILRAANAIIARNTERRPKNLFTTAGDGEPIVLFEGETERDEADFVAGRITTGIEGGMSPRDFAVFYRTNAQSRVLEDALRARDLPYVVVGGTRFFDRAEIKTLIAYLRAIVNPDDAMALQRVINVPARGIGDATVERVAALAHERRISFHAALEEATAEGSEWLGAGPRKRVAAFLELLRGLRGEADALGPAALAERVMEVSGYRDALAADSTIEAEGRLENLLELIAQMREYEKEAEEPTLVGFLERVALASDVDGYDAEKGAVSLMTVHTAKGLEFPSVVLTGMEERIFPHARSVDDDSAVEEERRLCYVAVTRARKQLALSRVRRRRLSGQELPGIPSRFLAELPAESLEVLVMDRPSGYGGSTEGQGPWGGRWSRDSDYDAASRSGARGAGRGGSGGAGRSSPAARPRSAGGELVVDYDVGPAAGDDAGPGLVVGMKLGHAQFGVGEVRGWQGVGADLKVTIRFPQAGVKTILARFLKQP
jgi:DNA helicase-2/ATP-dependent DNA helicase PcrA